MWVTPIIGVWLRTRFVPIGAICLVLLTGYLLVISFLLFGGLWVMQLLGLFVFT